MRYLIIISFCFFLSLSVQAKKKKMIKTPPCICTMIYMPVCGENKKDYSNSCQANCAGIKKYTMGTCQEIKDEVPAMPKK